MAGLVPNVWRARLLEATAGRTAITTGTRYLGLAFSLPEDPALTTLANLVEVNTAGYARIAVPAFSAATTVAPVQIKTGTAFQIGPLTADMATAASFAFLTDVLTGTAGIIQYIWALPQPLLGRSGEPLVVPANTLIIE